MIVDDGCHFANLILDNYHQLSSTDNYHQLS